MNIDEIKIFDADGHVWEDDDELAEHFEGRFTEMQRYKTFSFFPGLDGWPRGFIAPEMDPVTNVDVWQTMLTELRADGAALYPTSALAHGLIQEPEWAAATATAYNNWLEERYTKLDDRLFGVGLMAVQNPDAAVTEMRRCRTERERFVAMMLPSVTAAGRSYGDEFFWPIFEEAERLDMPLGVHGGVSRGMGFDHFTPFIKVHTLEHPIPLFYQLTDMVFSGVFEEFPSLRVAFLEGGSTWVPWMMDRLDYEYGWLKHQAPRLSQKPSDYMRGDSFWVSAELDEPGLVYCIDAIGSDRILYPSDYPHERQRGEFSGDVPEFLERSDVADETKQKILHDNALTFYGLD